VTQKEFEVYYKDVSASIDDDDYFALMMTNAWNLNNVLYSKGWGDSGQMNAATKSPPQNFGK